MKCGEINNITEATMNKIYNILLALVIVSLLASCYEEENWLEDNITPTGEYYPTIYMNSLGNEYKAGASVEVVLEFASQGTLNEIVLYQQLDTLAETEVSRTPYTPAFSEIKAQDTLALTYVVPAITDTTEITLRAEAINTNGLTASSGNTFEAIP